MGVMSFSFFLSLCVFAIFCSLNFKSTSSQEMPRDNNMAKFIWAVPWPCSEAALSHFSVTWLIHRFTDSPNRLSSTQFDDVWWYKHVQGLPVLLQAWASIHILKWAKVATQNKALYSISACTSSTTEVESHLSLLVFIPWGVLTSSYLVIVFKERQIVLSKMMTLLGCRTIEVLCLLQILNLSQSQRNTLHGNRVN